MEHHAYQLYLAVENIDNTKMKARHPRTNGIAERFHRTMKKEEFYNIAFSKKISSSLEEILKGLGKWLYAYDRLWESIAMEKHPCKHF